MAELKKTQLREKLREMSDCVLATEIAAQRAAIYSLRQRNKMKQLNNTAAIRDARRAIAVRLDASAWLSGDQEMRK